MSRSNAGIQPKRRSNGTSARVVNTASLNIRMVGTEDLVPLSFFFDTALRKDYFMRRGQLQDILGDKYHQVYVAEIDSILVAVAITTRGSRLVNALVHPAYRGLGIGRELVRRSGVTEVRVKTDASSGDPRGFYRALGFKPTGQCNRKGNIEVMRCRPAAVNGRRRAANGK
ncbi:MAG: GNAT family N-acetyltransferase [Planctomycetota bacterium]